MELNAASTFSPPLLSSPTIRPVGDTPIQPDKTQAVVSATDLEHATKPIEKAESGTGSSSSTEGSKEKKSPSTDGSELTEEELQLVEELEVRDREVRQHEQAHANVGGQYTGAPELQYTRGPDGRMYATSGEVSVDTSAIPDDPQATIEKMRTIISAALAPAEPSSQDYQVAAKAQALMNEALVELSKRGGDPEEAEESGSEQSNLRTSDPDSATREQNQTKSNESESDQEGGVNRLPTLDGIRLEMERRLVETGVFTKAFPEGSIIEQQV